MEFVIILGISVSILVSSFFIYWFVCVIRAKQKCQQKELEDIKVEIRLIKKMLLSDRIIFNQIEQCVNNIEDKLNETKQST